MVKEEIENTNFLQINEDGKHGYILKVDLSYPPELHDIHSDFPLAPETLNIKFEHLSPYAKSNFLKTEKHTKYESEKLTSTFFPRKNYVVSLKNLQLYCSLGMRLTKIHKVLKFRQRKFLKPYIDMCTKARKNTKSSFKKRVFKLLSNANFGKFIEDPRKYSKVVLAQNNKTAAKLASSPWYISHKIINKKLVSFTLETKEVLLNKPFSVGMCILDYSKHFMFDFWYNKLLPLFNYKNIDLLMSDTDSFCILLHCKQGYMNAIEKLTPFFDFSNYPKSHPLYSNKNEKQLGYFKDELNGTEVAKRFCGLRAKCYAILHSDEKEKLVCKGLGRTAIKKRLHFSQYVQTLKSSKVFRHNFAAIESKNHNLSTVIRKKKCLSNFDSKRYILPCGIHSYPYGSILLNKYNFQCKRCMRK